jgi:hypothetical protein
VRLIEQDRLIQIKRSKLGDHTDHSTRSRIDRRRRRLDCLANPAGADPEHLPGAFLRR